MGYVLVYVGLLVMCFISAGIRRSDGERMAESMDPQNSNISLGFPKGFPMVFAELELGMAEVVFLFFLFGGESFIATI